MTRNGGVETSAHHGAHGRQLVKEPFVRNRERNRDERGKERDSETLRDIEIEAGRAVLARRGDEIWIRRYDTSVV